MEWINSPEYYSAIHDLILPSVMTPNELHLQERLLVGHVYGLS
jgi:hypothetical protein